MADLLKPRAAWEAGVSRFARETRIECSVPYVRQLMERATASAAHASGPVRIDRIDFRRHVPADVRARARERLNGWESADDESFIVEIGETSVTVCSQTERGLLYGANALLGAIGEDGFVRRGIVAGAPVVPVRGVKLYLPPPDGIAFFRAFVDMMVRYGYNTIVIEVGGAMEYRSHPEINASWISYCREMSEYSGKTIDIQEKTFNWHKNSMHVENGGGQVLPREQVSELVRYCKERLLNVIPEVPSLSHCDYLLLPHPELSERREDPYPDTYCPSDERSYALLFDVLEEVLDVFEPHTVHIGHDEYYTIGRCERCAGRPAAHLFAEDIRRIYTYLQRRGVGTMMWGDKLIDAVDRSGRPYGGAERPMKNYDTGVYMGETIPATHGAIELIPRDIDILHWYWSIDDRFEQTFHSHGLPMTYGNFHGHSFVDWSRHVRHGAKGGIISNWSETTEDNMQRNLVMFSLLYSACLFWREEVDDSRYGELAREVFAELFRYRYEGLIRQARERPATGTAYVEVLHNTGLRKEYVQFYDGVFLNNDEHRIGEHVLEYDDGSEYAAPIVYGLNISNRDVSWARPRKQEPSQSACYACDSLLLETAYSTEPVLLGGETWYRWIIANPDPSRTVRRVRTRANDPVAGDIAVKRVTIV